MIVVAKAPDNTPIPSNKRLKVEVARTSMPMPAYMIEYLISGNGML
ncbi:MAG: hypothetical protein QM405_04175 [Euryarchaeota archaeon]|jgi:hypothetical protein|nr:hypothetical protein [Euryarchaeota archaeon]